MNISEHLPYSVKKSTEKHPMQRNPPGAQVLAAHLILHAECHTWKMYACDCEEWRICSFSFRRSRAVPMVVVPVGEDAPFRVLRHFRRGCRTFKALVKGWHVGVAGNLVCHAVDGACCISKPVADHNPRVSRRHSIELVDDLSGTSRQYVGVIDVFHKDGGFEFNDNGSAKQPPTLSRLKPIEPLTEKYEAVNNFFSSSHPSPNSPISTLKKHYHFVSSKDAQKSQKCAKIEPLTSTSNLGNAFSMCVISTNYISTAQMANLDD